MYYGDYAAGATVGRKFYTTKADGTPITLAGGATAAVYKQGSNAESTAGVTLTVDYDSRTGLHDIAINTAADSTFYAAGNDFSVVLTAGTIDSIPATPYVVMEFSIANRAVKPQTGDSYAVVTNATYGNQALGTAIGAISPVSSIADSGTITSGNQVANTYASTATDNDTRWTLSPSAGGLSATLTFGVGVNRSPLSVATNGYWNGSGQVCHVSAYNYANATWDQLTNSSTALLSRTGDTNYSYGLSREHIAEDGTVQIRYTSASTNGAHRLYLDRVLVYSVAEAGGGSGATPQAIWEYGQRTVTSAANITSTNGTILLDTNGYVTYNNDAPLDAAGIRLAIGLASANLDTQLGDIPTVSEFEARTILASNYVVATTWTNALASKLDGAIQETP